MENNVIIRLIDLLDKHPSLLFVIGGMMIVFGVRIPWRVRGDDGALAWQFVGAPGIGQGLVSLGQGLVKFSSTLAAERAKDRTAHAAELQANKTAIEQMSNTVKELCVKLADIAARIDKLLGPHMVPERLSSAGQTTPCSPGSEC